MRYRPEDIYKKDLSPRFGRRKHLREGSSPPASSQPASPPPSPPGFPSSEADPALPHFEPTLPVPDVGFHQRPPPGGRSGRRRRRHHGGGPPIRLVLLWGLALVGVLGAYVSLMVFYKGRGQHGLPAHMTAEAPPSPPAAPPAQQTTDPSLEDASGGAEAMATLIREIKESRAFLDRLLKPPLSKLTPEEQLAACESRLLATPHFMALVLETARRYAEHGNHARAADLYRQALAINPANRDARLALAQVQLKARDHNGAEQTAQWMLEEESYSLDARQVLATVYMSRGQPLNAVPHLRAIVEGDSLNVIARNNLAVVYTQLGEYDKAIRTFRGVIEQNDNNPVAYNNLALCLARKGDLVEATATLRQAARKFGAPFVASWIAAKEFDGVRDFVPFRQLADSLASHQGLPGSGSGVLLETPLKAPQVEVKPSDELPLPGQSTLPAQP